jgi:hypothetical protein
LIRIAITVEAYEAIARTLALGTVAAEPGVTDSGERVIWLEERWLNKLNSIRRPGETNSQVIVRLAALWEGYPTHGPKDEKPSDPAPGDSADSGA